MSELTFTETNPGQRSRNGAPSSMLIAKVGTNEIARISIYYWSGGSAKWRVNYTYGGHVLIGQRVKAIKAVRDAVKEGIVL